MAFILSGIHTLNQHLSTWLSNPQAYKPNHCPHCFSTHLWAHGCYERKAQCEIQANSGCSVPIPRFLCAICKRTCSTLPEFIPPRRWYYWLVQQLALSLLLIGGSLLSVWFSLFDRHPRGPSQSTLQRWFANLKHQHHEHHFCLCSVMPELGYTPNFTDFWQACLQKIPLSSAMVMVHRSGFPTP